MKRMQRHPRAAASTFLALGTALISTTTSHAVTFDFVTVGNPGNAADPLNSGSVPGIGSVGYSFGMSKYEVTNAQYAEFLNAVDAGGTNTRALYRASMDTDARGGLTLTPGNANGSKYVVKSGRDNNPVVFVSWYDAARMANWVQNGQGSGSTESGVYTLTSNTTISGGRSAGATIAIPNENEWYKAAYHQPTASGGDADGYWLYPTGTNTVPTGDAPPGGANSANFYGNNGYAVSQSFSFVSSTNYLTNVGAYTTADSFYGTFDQGGNVFEWNETLIGSSRGVRGGSWGDSAVYLRSDDRFNVVPELENSGIGFRLASIPEPSSVSLFVGIGMATLMSRRRMRSSSVDA